MKTLLVLLGLFIYSVSSAQRLNNQLSIIDIQHYDIKLSVNNSSINVEEIIKFKSLNTINSFFLELIGDEINKHGMQIESLQIESKVHSIKHRNDTIFISGYNFLKDSIYSLKLRYQGQPTNGLIIGKNKFGDTTYFCDHWPNRAHHWLACIDHPSDKATVSVQITAPKKFTCVSNGKFESKISKENTITSSYSTTYPLPLKVIVFGLAELVHQVDVKHHKIKITNYAYPQDSLNVFKDFKETKSILEFYENLIGDFPFEKLDNVQSTTQFGGMENAGCIFYDENAFEGKGLNRLIAHELVHQWFGNSVTEKDWSQLWLSEGFATYLTNLYIEKNEGHNEFIQQLKKDRQRVIHFQKQFKAPLQDTITKNLMELLNPNAYQRGAWVLHMLRNEVGHEKFQQIISTFYRKYKYSNASTNDFFEIVEKLTDKSFDDFKNEWTASTEIPTFKIQKNENKFKISQTNSANFHFKLAIDFRLKSGKKQRFYFDASASSETFSYDFNEPIEAYILDPETVLLFTIE